MGGRAGRQPDAVRRRLIGRRPAPVPALRRAAQRPAAELECTQRALPRSVAARSGLTTQLNRSARRPRAVVEGAPAGGIFPGFGRLGGGLDAGSRFMGGAHAGSQLSLGATTSVLRPRTPGAGPGSMRGALVGGPGSDAGGGAAGSGSMIRTWSRAPGGAGPPGTPGTGGHPAGGAAEGSSGRTGPASEHAKCVLVGGWSRGRAGRPARRAVIVGLLCLTCCTRARLMTQLRPQVGGGPIGVRRRQRRRRARRARQRRRRRRRGRWRRGGRRRRRRGAAGPAAVLGARARGAAGPVRHALPQGERLDPERVPRAGLGLGAGLRVMPGLVRWTPARTAAAAFDSRAFCLLLR